MYCLEGKALTRFKQHVDMPVRPKPYGEAGRVCLVAERSRCGAAQSRVGIVLLFGATALHGLNALGQLVGSLHGQIFDPSGFVIAGAQVTLHRGHCTLKTVSGSNGKYSVKAIPVGMYIVVISAPGFGTFQKEDGAMLTTTPRFHHLSLHGSYTYSDAKSDTQEVTYVPSVASDPSLDYGRATFGIKSRLSLLGTYAAPYGITFAPLIAAQSGTPYSLVIGSDLTQNNQFNARPFYGGCGAPDVISTPFGCLDPSPIGKEERLVPYGAAVGPSNFIMHLRV